MRVKKSNGKVYGADFTAAERKAIELEIGRQLSEYTRKHANELDAMILWFLHEEFGFGKNRLKKCYKGFSKAVEELASRYEMATEMEKVWVCTKKLKDYGVDLEEWYKELG